MECYRHPEITARRKCYKCRNPICPSCQTVLDHHVFCGTECHEKWRQGEAEKWKSPKDASVRPFPEETFSADVRDLAERVSQLRTRMEVLESALSKLSHQFLVLLDDVDVARQTGKRWFFSLAAVFLLAAVFAGIMAHTLSERTAPES